jgi:hypothetical protein
MFSKGDNERLAASTVKGTIHYVSATFREYGYPNPTLDEDGELAWILQREFRSFKNLDPAEKHQAAIPIIVIIEINKQTSSELKRATTQLVSLAIFLQ